MKILKPWRFVAAFLIGIIIGFPAGAWFYAKVLDKPETVMEIGKQKIKGRNNEGNWNNINKQEQEEQEPNKGWWFFNKNKED